MLRGGKDGFVHDLTYHSPTSINIPVACFALTSRLTSSISGIPGLAIYAGSIFCVRALTQSAGQYVDLHAVHDVFTLCVFLAMEWGSYGITVNAYAPGLIDTPMSKLLTWLPRIFRTLLRYIPGAQFRDSTEKGGVFLDKVSQCSGHVIMNLLQILTLILYI